MRKVFDLFSLQTVLECLKESDACILNLGSGFSASLNCLGKFSLLNVCIYPGGCMKALKYTDILWLQFNMLNWR